MSVAALSLGELASQCSEQTEKFSQRESPDNRYCFELLRRALADDLREAFTHVYNIYDHQVRSWVFRCPRFNETGEDVDYFVNFAFSKFYFAVRGPKFAHFTALPALLSYLKQCVFTAVAQYLRDVQAAESLGDDDDLAELPDQKQSALIEQGTDAAELWALICERLPDERDRWLARCAFTLDMKPADIVQAYPGRWRNEREISVALFRIRSLLRNDAGLRQWLGTTADARSAAAQMRGR